MEPRLGSAKHGYGGTPTMIDQRATERRAKHPRLPHRPGATTAGGVPPAAPVARESAPLQPERAYKFDGNYIQM